MAFERFSLNIIPDGEMPVFHASQFDAGRPIIIDLYNGDDAYTPAAGVTFELHCRKVDDNIVTLDSYEVDGNTVTFASTEQLCACSGDNLCEVAIMLDELLMGTLNFILRVERDPIAGGLTSETSIYNLQQQIDDIISGEGYVKDTDLEVLQSDWDETDVTSPAYIKNKPGPSTYEQADWTETDPSAQSYIKHKPDLKAVATSGSYNDLTDKPTIPAAQVNSDWNASSGVAEILNKPTIPTKTSELTNDSDFVESTDLATVATTGDYEDLLNKPAIPAAQVQSDWNQTNSGAVDYIKNKPDLTFVKSATGNPCSFSTDLTDNLISVKANIVASGGGGTPSVPIPIVGYSQAVITANSTPITIAFGQTVYGGVLDVTNGKLVVTWARDKISDCALSTGSYSGVDYFVYVQPLKKDGDFNIKGDCFVTANQSGVPSMPDNSLLGSGNYIFIRADYYATVSELKEAVGDYYIYYELDTPIEITNLTPTAIPALSGVNNITSDLGGNLEVRYTSGDIAGQIIDICKMVIAEMGE